VRLGGGNPPNKIFNHWDHNVTIAIEAGNPPRPTLSANHHPFRTLRLSGGTMRTAAIRASVSAPPGQAVRRQYPRDGKLDRRQKKNAPRPP
jgi:hypothetical protein